MYYCISIYVCVQHFYEFSTLVGCWSSVSIRRIIYKFLNVCPFDYTAVAVSGKVERPWTGLRTPVGLTAVIPTGRPKSVRDRCVIEVFDGVCYVVTMIVGFFCGWQFRDFCFRTESRSLPFSLPYITLIYRINLISCKGQKQYILHQGQDLS